MNIRILILAWIAYILFAPSAQAQNDEEACNWYGREIVPLCQNAQTGWARENGIRCISRDQCINGQPSDRGGIVGGGGGNDGGGNNGGGNDGGGNTGGGNSGSADQCNTTSQCKAIYGNSATDCLNSQSSNSICMCGSQRCDAGGGDDGGGGNGGDEFGGNVDQPSSSCSNVGNNIPSDIRLHNIFSSNIARSNFSDTSRWYREEGEVQRFQLFEGDQNQRTGILRPRIEAFAPGARFKRGSGWHEFSANYYLADWDEAQRYALFQIKTNDASNFIIQVLLDDSRRLEIARRSKGSVTIMNDAYRKPFNLRVRSNGERFEVYLNCERVLAEAYPQPSLVNNNTENTFRWGLYRQQQDDDKHDGTTTLYVTGPKLN